MGLLARLTGRESPNADLERSSIDQWITDYLQPSQVVYNGVAYPLGQQLDPSRNPLRQTIGNNRVQHFDSTLPSYSSALRSCPPAFAAQLVRASVLSQARFVWRNRPGSGGASRKIFGTRDLARLETPWPNGTTGDLIAQIEWHSGLAGNAFVFRQRDRLRILRPDWVGVVWASEAEPENAPGALDSKILGYVYANGGFDSGNPIQTLAAEDVAHWYPLPDPLNPGVGMSWITPAVREIRGDLAASQHKLQYFENGATPNLVVKGITAPTQDQFDQIVDKLEARHRGIANAYRTLYLGTGADATIVGSNMQQIDFAAVIAGGETRLSVLSRVPAALLGITEGLKGAALNSGNFGMARRIFSDTWVTPTLQNLCASLAPIVSVPNGAELWFDTTDMPLLREDAADAAGITQVQAATIVELVNAGFDPDRATAAVTSMDLTTLSGQHSGMLSVQLQPPNAGDPSQGGNGVRDGTDLDLVMAIQKIYLGVGTVITADEARTILNGLGANLDVPGPELTDGGAGNAP